MVATPLTAFAEDAAPLFSSSQATDGVEQAAETIIGQGSIRRRFDLASDSDTLRHRTAWLDLGRLHVLNESDSDTPIALNLFGDVSFRLAVPQFAPTSSGYSLSGNLDGMPLSTVVLVVNNEVVVGSVHTSTTTYTIRSIGQGGLVRIRELSPEFRFEEPPALFKQQSAIGPRPAVRSALGTAENEDGEATTVDLLVVWSPEAEDDAGGRENMVANIDHLAAFANKVFGDSGAQIRLNIPHMQKVETEDDGGLNVWHALHGRKTTPDDGNVRQVVMDLRDRVGADLVHFVASGHHCAGIANIPTSVEGNESHFLSMSKYACRSTVFVHEIGHNFGLHHERFLDARQPLKVAPYSHGYVNQAAFKPDAPASAHWRTVMAYGDQCEFACPWIPRLSNPDDEYLGDPLGVPGETETHGTDGPADARRTINEMRSAIAGYRAPLPNLSISATVDETALDIAERFSLVAEIANLGRVQAMATTLTVYRSTDADFSRDDEEAGRLAIDALGPSSDVSHSLDLAAPAQPGTYYYLACVDEAAAVSPCDAVHVTVGPTVSISNAEAIEGQAIRFRIGMSETFPADVEVNYNVSRDTAVEGLDYEAAADGTVTIPAGDTEAWIQIDTIDDAVAEPSDSLRVTLSASTPDAPDGPVVSTDGGSAGGTIVDNDGEFAIPDPRLRQAVLRALDRASDEEITIEDMATLTELTARSADDLTGLEFATGLLSLDISSTHSSTNLAAVGHLSALRFLVLRSWRGGDLRPLRSLKTLRALDLSFSAVEDLSPIAGLTELRDLSLRGALDPDGDSCNKRGDVSDISPLSGLVNMRELHLECNRVTDLRALSDMAELRQLWVTGNEVSSLVGLEHMPSLWLLALDGNPLSDLFPIRDLTGLSWLTLNGTSVSDLSPLRRMTRMTILSLANNGVISNISALRSLRSCGDLDLSGNNISNLSPLRDLESLWRLNLGQNRISELSPLSDLAVRRLNLDGNLIADVSPLRDVPLRELSLRRNLIEDISPLSEIDSLTHLSLDGNKISDIGPLAKLTGLQRLSLGRNAITDISALAHLAEIVELDLSDNYLSDVAPLADLSRLESLQLGNNVVEDVSALAVGSRLRALRELYLYGNPLAEESVVKHLAHLRDAGVSVYRAIAMAMDASAKEGEVVEAVVRLTEAATGRVAVSWGVLGSTVFPFRFVVDVEVTASSDDFDNTGACLAFRKACRWVRIPAGETAADTYLQVLDDDRLEPHEVFVIELSQIDNPARTVSLPHKRPGWASLRTSQAVGLIVDSSGPSHTVPLFPTAEDDARQGFVRIFNRGGRSAVHIEAFDSEGVSSSTTLSIRRGHTVHFNSNDLKDGNYDKGLSRGVGTGRDDWRLRLWSNDIQALSYIRTADGFVTSMHDLVAEGPDGTWSVPMFNPGSNLDQVSQLRLFNEGHADANIEITGIDDAGTAAGPVGFSLGGGLSRTINAQQLESGEGLDGALGDGQGKWRLSVKSDAPIAMANLLKSQTGYLTNLSTVPTNQETGDGETTHHIPYFPSAADEKGRQGLARIVNHGTDEAAVRIVAYDDAGPGYSTSLTVSGGTAVQFDSDDLEMGSAEKRLEGVGAGMGHWRLELKSPAKLDVLAYIRHRDGFLTSMHDVVSGTEDNRYEVPTFNPGSNLNQVSNLLLANSTGQDASVTIAGVDDRGDRHGEVSLEVRAQRTVMLSAQELESGSEATAGHLGDGNGKWRLIVTSDQPLWLMSLLESPTGHVTNLSTEPGEWRR